MIVNDLEFIGVNENSARVYKCPLCGGEIKINDNVFYGRCDACLATLIDYKPLDYQVAFHESKAKFRENIGAYGTGKTTMDCAEIMAHVFSTPNGKTLLTGQTIQQVKEAFLPELEKFLPPWFFSKKPVVSPLPKYSFTNGHEIVVFASNDEQNLRSLNLTAFCMIEASGIDFKVFDQLKARLRNKAAVVKDAMGNEIDYRFMGLVETNPEEGWVRDEFLLRASIIKASKSVDTSSYEKLKTKKPEPSFHAFLSATPDNKYLHKRFIEDLCAGKGTKWIRKYIYCYLETKEGVVYPEFIDCIVDPKPIKDTWQRIFGFDKGWADETCLCCGAIDPIEGICYVYDEYYEKQRPMTYHAAHIKEKISGLPMYKQIQADPSVRNSNDRDGVSYKDYFYNISGISLEPANNSIADGIERVRDFMYTGKLKFSTNCVNIKEEAQNYVWKKDKDGILKDDPVDRRNHLMDAVRYMVMALPMDLKDVGYAKNDKTKDNLINRLQPNSSVDDYFNDTVDGFGGVYGINTYKI